MLGAALMGVGGWTYASKIEPDWLDFVRLPLTLPRLDAAFTGFRLAHITDIHLSEALTSENLYEACDRILEEEPDLIAITGDLIDQRTDLAQSMRVISGALSYLAKQVPVVAVPGNHDYRLGWVQIRQMMEDAGVRVLVNNVIHIDRAGAQLHIVGMDDALRGKPDLAGVLARLPDTGAAIVLAHEPDFAVTSVQAGRFDLQISGHSHGGQVNLPFVGSPILPKLGRIYPSGLYQLEQHMLQYTSRGLGTTSPHVRLNCRPEITLFRLQSRLSYPPGG